MTVISEVQHGLQAIVWMNSADNILAWHKLAKSCPWTTPYQLPEFARVWLHCYTDWEPLLIISRDSAGQLRGIFPLAKQGELVTGMGAHQAEYQGWLCHENEAKASLDSMLEALFNTFRKAHLKLGYIDLGTLTPQLHADLKSKSNMRVSEHPRPLLELNAAALAATLRKSANKSKLNRLRRLGNLEFLADDPGSDIAAALDQVIALYDLRQGAVNGTSPFLEDPRKRDFHLHWLRQDGSGLMFYRLMLDDQVIGALLGVAHGQMVSNTILASSATLARHSPGKLIIYMAAEHMIKQGYKSLDLTPGGDAWKERFASSHDRVLHIQAWADNAPLKRLRRRERAEAFAGGLLAFTPIRSENVRSFVQRVSHKIRRRREVLKDLRLLMPQHIEYRIYRLTQILDSAGSNKLTASSIAPNINSISDLLLYDDSASWRNRQDFLAMALARLERGQCSYTIVENGRLLHYGWQATKQGSSFFSEVQTQYDYPILGIVLYDFFTHPSARGRGLYQQTLAFMLNQQSKNLDPEEPQGGVVYISALASNKSSIHVIEKLGFEYVESISRKAVLKKFIGEARRSGPGEI